MRFSTILWFILAMTPFIACDTVPDNTLSASQSQSPVQTQPAYSSGKPQDTVASYAAATYNVPQTAPATSYGGYEPVYGDQNPSMYDYMIATNYPHVKNEQQEIVDPVRSVGTWLPMFRQALGIALKIISKLGFMVLGGAGLIVMGMAVTTAVCSLTPLCEITFFNGQGVSKETVRSLLTPEKITATAHFVKHAIDKYQQLQHIVD